MKKHKIPCFIMAIDSSVGSGRNMDAYYKSLEQSIFVKPIMVYSHRKSFVKAPFWIRNKILLDMPYATHPLDLCSPEYCDLLPDQHIPHDQWMHAFANQVKFLKLLYDMPVVWILDMILPIIEKPMKDHIVQVFHGELFDIGPLPYAKESHKDSLHSYKRLLLCGEVVYDVLVKDAKLSPDDTRIRPIGRVLDDTLYDGSLNKKQIIQEYKLKSTQKTLLYAPSWESFRIWPAGDPREDKQNFKKLCDFVQEKKLNLIIRPHPVSIIQYGMKEKILPIIKGYSNIYFDDSSISSYLGPNKSLVAADIMITDLSSISAEFFALGKPVIYFYPDKTKGLWEGAFPSLRQVQKLSYTVTNFEDLLKTITKIMKTAEPQHILKKRKKIANHLLYYRDGSASYRFLKEIDSYAQEIQKKEDSVLHRIRRHMKHRLFPFKKSIFSFAAQLD